MLFPALYEEKRHQLSSLWIWRSGEPVFEKLYLSYDNQEALIIPGPDLSDKV